jgi:hypothetical protein
MSNVIDFKAAKVSKVLRSELVAFVNSSSFGEEDLKREIARLVEEMDVNERKNR